ncbi:hypothetical protein ACFFWD_07525 [Bradyrhizobium erythrophlei]
MRYSQGGPWRAADPNVRVAEVVAITAAADVRKTNLYIVEVSP